MPSNRGSEALALLRELHDLYRTRASNSRPSLTLDASILRTEHLIQQLVVDDIGNRSNERGNARRDARGSSRGDARESTEGRGRGDARGNTQGSVGGRDQGDAQENAEGTAGGHDSGHQMVNDPCPICLERKQDPLETPCHHVFCADCIEYWLDEEGNDTCPSCRADLDSRDLRPVNCRRQGTGNPATAAGSRRERDQHSTANVSTPSSGNYSSTRGGHHRPSHLDHDHRPGRTNRGLQTASPTPYHRQDRSGADHRLPLLPLLSPRDRGNRRSPRDRQRSPPPQGPPQYDFIIEEYIEYHSPQSPQPHHQTTTNETPKEAAMRTKIEQMRVLLNRSEPVPDCIAALNRRHGNVFAAVAYLRDHGAPRTVGEQGVVEMGEAITRELRGYPVGVWGHLVEQ